jgi:Tol biopolymer transport system component
MKRTIFRIIIIYCLAFVLVACGNPAPVTPTILPPSAPTETTPELTPTFDPRKSLPKVIQDCWVTPIIQGSLLSPPHPQPFLYLPFEGTFGSQTWSSQFDHLAPVYDQDGIIATLGETIEYNIPGEGLAGGTQAYNGGDQNIYFPPAKLLADIKTEGYKILGYQSPMYETYLFYDGHDGHDFAVTGKALAAGDGEIVFQGLMGSFGRVIQIYHSQGFITRYAHLGSFEDGIQMGTIVKAGQPIGTIGSSGADEEGIIDDQYWGDGVHLHFSVYRWNPSFNRWNIVDPFGWDPSAGPAEADNLEAQKKDPLFLCNGEISYNLWVDGWPRMVTQDADSSKQNPLHDRYAGGWAGDLPEYPQSLQRIAYVGADKGIWVLNDDGSGAQRLANSDGYSQIFWSPDGEKIAYMYFQNETIISIIDADGGNLINLSGHQPARIDYFSDLSWSPDGQLLALTGQTNNRYDIFTIKKDGSDLNNITNNTIGGYYYYLAWSPDGSRLAFVSNVPTRNLYEDLYVMNLGDQRLVNLTNIPDNELQGLFVHGMVVFPQKISWSPNGDFIAFVGLAQGSAYCGALGVPADCKEIQNIFLATPDGSSLTNLTGPGGSEGRYDWSPDGKSIAFESNRDGNSEIYLINTDGSGLINLTNNLAEDSSPTWSSDGEYIAFISTRDGNQEIYKIELDSGAQIRLTNTEGDESFPSYRPNGSAVGSPTIHPTQPPPQTSTNIDLTDPDTVISLFSNGLKQSDIQIFDQLLTEDTLSYGSGMAAPGGRVEISKSIFLQEMAERLPSQPACVGYMTTSHENGAVLMIWTSGWEPEWGEPGIPASSVLTFTLSLRNGRIYTSAYFTPNPAILDSPNVKSLPCP